MEKTTKHRWGALALTAALVMGCCLNSRPLYALGLAAESRPDRAAEQRPPVAGQIRLMEAGEDPAPWAGPLYDRLQQLSGGLWLAERQGRYGVLDSQGGILAPLIYQDEFSARRAAYGIQMDENRASAAAR